MPQNVKFSWYSFAHGQFVISLWNKNHSKVGNTEFVGWSKVKGYKIVVLFFKIFFYQQETKKIIVEMTLNLENPLDALFP